MSNGTQTENTGANHCAVPGALWAARAGALAAWVWERCVNRTDAWGAYLPLHQRGPRVLADGRKVNLQGPITAPRKAERGRVSLTRTVLQRHFSATRPEHLVGLHTTSPTNTSLWGATELDWHDANSCPPAKLLAAGLA